MNKNKEISFHQKKQKTLKNEIIIIKKKLPTYIIGSVFFTFLSFYFLEHKFYEFFGNSVNIIHVGIIIVGLFSLFFLVKSYLIIKQKQKESKSIGIKLYKIMKLESKKENE